MGKLRTGEEKGPWSELGEAGKTPPNPYLVCFSQPQLWAWASVSQSAKWALGMGIGGNRRS